MTQVFIEDKVLEGNVVGESKGPLGLFGKNYFIEFQDGDKVPLQYFRKNTVSGSYIHLDLTHNQVQKILLEQERTVVHKFISSVSELEPEEFYKRVIEFSLLHGWLDSNIRKEARELLKQAAPQIATGEEVSDDLLEKMAHLFSNQEMCQQLGVSRLLQYREGKRNVFLGGNYIGIPPLKEAHRVRGILIPQDLIILSRQVESQEEAEYLLRQAQKNWGRLDDKEKATIAQMKEVWL